jgi:hypothetical protein
MSDQDPRWHRWVAVGCAAAAVVAVIVFHDRIGADFWPPDSSRVGPNLVAAVVQAMIVTVVLALLYPPFRRAIHRFFDHKLDGIHSKLDALHQSHKDLHGKLDGLHARHDQHEQNHADMMDRLDRLEKRLSGRK